MRGLYRGWACWCVAVLGASLVLASGSALAQAASAAAGTAGRSEAGRSVPGRSVQRVGYSSSGMRGFERIQLPLAEGPGVALAANAGYGFTESQGATHGAHHRAVGSLAVGAALRDWLGFGVRFDGRHDVHPDDGSGSDSSTVGDPRLLARAGGALSERVLLGGELGLWIPGEDAPSLAFAASTLDLRVNAALLPPASPWTFAGSLGYRLDNSAQAAPELSTLRPGDRLALELSSFDAALFALGLAHRSDALELWCEASWDVLVGSAAPSALASPLRVQLGARLGLGSALQLAFGATIAASKRQARSDERLVPVEPRFALQAGLRYAFGGAPAASDEQATAEAVAPNAVHADAPAAASTRELSGRLLDASGAPVAGARVLLHAPPSERETTSDADGRYAFDDVPFGTVELSAERDGFAGAQWSAELSADSGALPDQTLPRRAVGELRGLALSFGGRPVRAQISVQALDPPEQPPASLNAGSDGRFRLELAPGRYKVEVGASGYVSQTRTIEIEADGVVILNLDLRAER